MEGVSGTWRNLTENVNQLAGNLTTQVRSIADVSTAVTRGDLTRSISVDAQGEVAELKDNINQMIANLRDTTDKNAQQDWLKTNLARIGGKMQGQRDVTTVCSMIMSEVTPTVDAHLGAFFLADPGDTDQLRLTSSYGLDAGAVPSFRRGEGIVGQAAVEKKRIRVPKVPEGYLRIESGLGRATPAEVVVVPVLFEEQVLGVIELATFQRFSALHVSFLDQLVETIGVVLNTILANVRTEGLLEQSQRLAQELQAQSVELQRTNAELEEKAALLSEQNRNIEIKNKEIELARLSLEERAEQLQLSSQYKSEFLANMSHELRTPLNSLIVLAKLLADNLEGNLSDKQTQFARQIFASGNDLLALINDILDLSKIEAGKMDVRPADLDLTEVRSYAESTFRPLAEQKGLELRVEAAADLPDLITTDGQRLQQVLKNLLSNAVKFTHSGSVTLRIAPVESGLQFPTGALADAEQVIAFSVTDTGIGVPPDKLKLIFEAFQQGDGTTSRKYGGTGLGLSISREIARLLGGSIAVESQVGSGSTFTLYLPAAYPYHDATLLPEQSDAAVLLPPQAAEAAAVPMLVPAPSPVSDGSSHSRLAGTTVLVIDDDARNVFALTSALEAVGIRVLYADGGKPGVGVLEQHPEVDCVLMDMMMPDMDGNETTAVIRRMPEFARLPVIFLTAKAMPGDKEKSLAAGATDYITKPVDLDRLLTVMAHWVFPRNDMADL